MMARRVFHFSFLLNVLLLAAVGWAARGRSSRLVAPRLPGEMAGTNHHTAAEPHRLPAAGALPEPLEVTEPFCWSQLESTDYRVYAARLRAISCPESTVRDIIVADVNELYHRRVNDLVAAVQNRFWELLAGKDELEKVVNEKERELDALKQEREALIDELLGPHTQSLADETAALERIEKRKQFLDFLPSDKVAQCLALDEKFARLRQELSDSQPPPPAPQSQARSKALQEQQEHEFQQLLAPDELAEFKLRTSRFADLRLRLPGFEASEDELKEIVRIQERFSSDPAGQQSQRDEMKTLLGETRVAEFERAQDSRYQEIYQLTERLELPAQAAADVFEMRKAAEDHAKRVRADSSLGEAARPERLKELHAETERAIAEALGPQAFEIYRDRWGQWLAQLEGTKP